MTTEAADAIRIVKQAPELPESAGLRISTASHSMNGSGPSFAVELARAPEGEDEVLEDGGAKLFLAPEASPALDDKLLDPDLASDGEVRFTLREQ